MRVRSRYLPEESDPEDNRYVFVYQVSIANEGTEAAQLLTRHWIITDSAGHVEEVRGPGVIGEQPRILPGNSHVYQSFCVLQTSRGTMQGSYQMLRDDQRVFVADIPAFVLSTPQSMPSSALN